jgi:tRNA-dihydrouridine synthase
MSPGLTISGSDPSRAVRFDPPVLLAPMEGITDTAFRGLVIGLGGVGSARGVGGACTEFLRIAGAPLSVKAVRRALGDPAGCPVGVQLMAAAPDHVAASVVAAEAAGAAFIDLNFGCPAPVVFDKCAGSALLAKPDALGAIVRAAVSATGLPVSAKIRAGIADASMLGEIVATIADAGAAMLTVHARLRTQAYSRPPTWEWIAQAREHLSRAGSAIPLVGNGGVDAPEDVARLRSETGCDGVMVGRAALARPFFFRELAGGSAPSPCESARFALRYHAAVAASKGERCATARLKQLLRWSGDALFSGCDDARARLLREPEAAAILGWLHERAAAEALVAS